MIGTVPTLAGTALQDQAVTGVQSYAGTSSPYTFNGLVRHYFLRRQPNLADLQVMLESPVYRHPAVVSCSGS